MGSAAGKDVADTAVGGPLNPVNREYLSQRLGFDVHTIEPEPIATGGSHSHVFARNTEAGELVLRVCKGWQGWWTGYFPDRVDQHMWVDQAWAVQRAREAGVPAPEIISSDRADRWTLMRRLPGVAVDAEYESWQCCPYDEKEFGVILRRLHAITPPGWGPIDDGGRALFDSWPSFLVGAARSALATARARNAISPTLCAQLEARWLPRLGEVDCGGPALLHMESLGFANLLYDPGTRKVTGLLDYEDCIGGDPLLEFLFMRFYFEHDDEGTYRRDSWQRQRHYDFERFAAGYGRAEEDAERLSLYQPFPYLDKLRWIDPGSPRADSYRYQLAKCIGT